MFIYLSLCVYGRPEDKTVCLTTSAPTGAYVYIYIERERKS